MEKNLEQGRKRAKEDDQKSRHLGIPRRGVTELSGVG